MIVEDDKESLEELQEILVSVGYDVKAIDDPASALEAANTTKPDCILLDLKMPKKSGFQVADELKHFSKVGRIPIIAMTAFFTETEHSLLLKMCGIRKCLRKPLDPIEVIEQIEIALSEKPGKEKNDKQSI